jgi:hypothetical protein
LKTDYPPPPSPPPQEVREEDEEEDEDDLSFNEFLEELDVKHADEVAIAASFEMHRQERGRATTTEEVVLLKSAIEASTGGDAEHKDQRIYLEAALEVHAHYWGRAVHPPPSPAVMLYEDMVITREHGSARRSWNALSAMLGSRRGSREERG